MPAKLEWSPPRDAVLCRLRAEGASWEVIAAELRISRNAATERGRRLGARLPPAPRDAACGARLDPNRAPLAAGAEPSWRALVAGSLLADSLYAWSDPMARCLGPIAAVAREATAPIANRTGAHA